MTALRGAIASLLIVIMAPGLAAQAPKAGSIDVETTLREAREEIQNFEKAGGKKDDPNHPVEKWLQAL